jgi:hypothetical protein
MLNWIYWYVKLWSRRSEVLIVHRQYWCLSNPPRKGLAKVLDNDSSMAIYYSFCGSNSGCETSGYHAKVVDWCGTNGWEHRPLNSVVRKDRTWARNILLLWGSCLINGCNSLHCINISMVKVIDCSSPPKLSLDQVKLSHVSQAVK